MLAQGVEPQISWIPTKVPITWSSPKVVQGHFGSDGEAFKYFPLTLERPNASNLASSS